MTTQQLDFFAILLIAFVLLITERLRNDVVAVLIILALAVTHLLSSDEALSGFGSEPAIVVAAIFVLSKALEQTGVAETIGNWIGRLAGRTYNQAILVIMPLVALFSAFTHHVTTTAIMLPVTLNFCRERNIAPSKLLMPLSFAASLGTTITIIGAPAFLVASDALQRAGRPGLSIFSITPIGIALSLVGTVFMLTIGRFLLPDRPGSPDLTNRFQFDKYFTELKILDDSPFVGKTLQEVKSQQHYGFIAVGWVRGIHSFRAPYHQLQLEAGDVLRVHATPEDLVAFHQQAGIELHPIEKFGGETPETPVEAEDMMDQLVQAVIAPRSDLIGRTLQDLDFRRRYGAIVVGLWRQHGFIHEELARVRLHAGDVLLIQGDQDALTRLEREPAFLMLLPFHSEPRVRRRAPLAAAIMLSTVVLAALNLVDLQIAMLIGAAAAILTGCITARQAYRAIDVRIYVFIAGAIPLGAAMQKTGASTLVAHWLQGALGGWPQVLILLAIFAVAAVITQFMSDAATTALLAPVAVALAQALGQPPEPYVVTVAMASIVAFLTPIGHHGNLLVYGPGRYQFNDFVRVGAPLTILLAVVVALLAPVLWPK